ncbi:hypothetical protein HOP50_04g28790 [Chloropicon primus]|nr:hypothetical protein HOP50_04g28790 [Chloropicon primus]
MKERDFEARFSRRINPSLSSYMESMEKERDLERFTTTYSSSSLRKKTLGQKPKKSVTFQDETKRVSSRQSRQSRSSNSKFRLPKWAREVPGSERKKQLERTCYSPSDYCVDLAREHNTRRCHTAASRCYLAALEYTPGDKQIHSAFKTSLAFIRNNRPYFVPKSNQARSHLPPATGHFCQREPAR